MEGCAKLENFLDENEIINIPESTKNKITEQFIAINNLVLELRNENSELNVILESEQFKFEKEICSARQQLQESTVSCTKLKSQTAELEESLNNVQKQWRDLQKTHDASMLELQTVKRDNELLNQEKRNLTEQLEKRRNEIEKLNDDLKSLLDQVTKANEAKFQAIAVSEESKLKESNLQHQVNRLEQERDLLTRQISDLNAELNQKNSEVHALKREISNNSLELKAMLEDRADEVHMIQKRLDCLKEVVDERDARIEALAEKIRNLNESHSKSEEQFNLELSAQAKLIELHKNASEDNQKRVQELMRAFEGAQKLLKESNEATEEMEKHCHEVEMKSRAQLEERQAEIERLKGDLRRAKEVAQGLDQETIEKIFPVAAATSKVLHSGMTLTELYVEYTRCQEELRSQKMENASLTRELKQIIAEIEEKTPVINQRMQEYDKLSETISCLKSQLANALADYERVLEERNDSKRICNLANRENTRLKSQVSDLNRQVQVLLKEVEEARGGTIKHRRDTSAMNEEVTSSDEVTAAKIISRHLVTFQDIMEIQMKNQKLLTVIRDLSEQQEEMEKKLSSELTTKFEKEIENLSSQLEDLQKKRAKQSEMLETIVRQRDMYRVLLQNQGFSPSLLGQSDGSPSTSMMQKSAAFSPDSKMKEAKVAMKQLQTEFDNYKKEKAKNEKMLTEQIDAMRVEISGLRIQNAKLASQVEYSEERVNLLQSNLETYKKEHASFKEKNRQHTSMMVQHQQTINSLRQDLMLAQEKLAKSDVTIENLKAERDLLKSVESRLLQEKESVIREQQHQSRMMSNLQAVQNNLERIESETKRNLQYQVEKYEKEVGVMRTKLENANEEYRSALQIWEKQKKELQTKIDAEIERNRKTHDDLIDSYSKVHSLSQELASTKASLNAEKSEKPKAAESPVKVTPTKTVPNLQATAEIRHLKEQLSEAQAKLIAAQEKFNLANKNADQYLSMCKDLELRVKEQDEINKHLKESMDSALKSSTNSQSSLEKNLEKMEKTNRELLEENMKLTQDTNTQINVLQKKLTDANTSIFDFKNQAESSKQTAKQAREDCLAQTRLMKDFQEKYERELMLHAQDIQILTQLKEEHQHCTLKIEQLTQAAKAAEEALADCRESWSRQEKMLLSEMEGLKAKAADLQACNENLHNQLELMGTQMAALQSKNWDETPYSTVQADLKDTHHLLQVIQFIKKEKEIASTQYDVVQSENVRLNLKVDQLNNELNSTRAELNEVMNNVQAKAASEAQHSELLKKIEMMNLLTESNNLLRMEKESLTESKAKLESQFLELNERVQPLVEKEKELSQQLEMFSTENAALRSEVKNWQSRTNQLLEQSHRIGPQEYRNLMREMDELKAQKNRIAEELQRKQAENSQLSASVSSLRKEVEAARSECREKADEVLKMNESNVENQKTMLQIKKIGRKYKTQYDELKASYDTLVVKSEAAEAAIQQGQNLQAMQKQVEDANKAINELKEEISKEKEAADQAKKAVEDVQVKANEKEEKAKKLLATFRQKYSQLNSQKDGLASQNVRINKEITELKARLPALMQSKEENEQAISQLTAKVTNLEKELKKANDQKKDLQKQYDDLLQKVSQQKQSVKNPIVGLGERTSGEPLMANIKPLTSPSTSGASTSLRHSPHPASNVSRATPTASIRPMAIGTATPTSQARMATVLPTTATPAYSEEDSVLVVSPSSSVPHAAVQPTPATATVAPTTMAVVTVSPVVSEVAPVTPTVGHEEPQTSSSAGMVVHAIATVCPQVPPRIDIATENLPESVDSPAPTTSVIVSPPATQVVTPTVKRPRDESPGSSEGPDPSLKRIRMVSEGSQTNQPITSVVTPTNIAVAAQIVPRTTPEPTPAPQAEPPLPPPTGAEQVAETQPDLTVAASESAESDVLDDKEEQIIDWESQEESKIDDEFETENMEEATIDEVDDVEQMQEVDARTPDDEDMTEEQQDDAEEMLEQPIQTAPDIDILDSASDIQMDADSSSLQSAPTEMAPPSSFPPTLEAPSPAPEVPAALPTPAPRTAPSVGPPRLERQPPISRQLLTPFTIPGQGSNFEEGDDGIVPSTPTLYVPRRTDGFAEAVSSPHVPQVRFLFSSSDSSPTQQGLSQLASQGGVDDTRMDLSQFDEGGRTVPSTPVQVSPPAEATVPDVTAVIEAPVISTEIPTIPVIKIDLVDESTLDLSSTSDKTEIFPEMTASTSTDKLESKDLKKSPSSSVDVKPSEDAAPVLVDLNTSSKEIKAEETEAKPETSEQSSKAVENVTRDVDAD